MKILFAVSNENVSNKIVDSYTKKYGEAVSFKNVFYFNAIIRELQKDKTYDRIVISEDLEPFSNNNYDIIDKFIVERLREISYVITRQDGRNIDIVVICTDRRTKSSYVLSKMYEYGIYNALVGTDRRIDNVCSLLQEPRTSADAKEYYNITATSDEVNSIEDVSEQEVQNILIHYKRLGRNEERYADSFNNIAAQYTDKQLKIIIKCLPINVRAVLEAECPKYQELVTYAEESEEERKQKERIQEQRKLEQLENDRRLREKIEREKRDAIKSAQKTQEVKLPPQSINSGIDLLDNKRREVKMTGNVIIPNNMDIRKERKIYSDEELSQIENQRRTGRMGDLQSAGTRQTVKPENVGEEKSGISNTLPGFDDFENQPIANQGNVTSDAGISLPGFDDFESQPASNQGNISSDAGISLPGFDGFESQPASNQGNVSSDAGISLPGFDDFGTQSISNQGNISSNGETILPGLEDIKLPESPILQSVTSDIVASQVEEPQEEKRGRGRPRKYPVEPPKPKGKRGRPRKNPLPEESNSTTNIEDTSYVEKENSLPGFNDIESQTSTNQVNTLPDEEMALPGFEENVITENKPLQNPTNNSSFGLPGTELFDEPEEKINLSTSRVEMPTPEIDNQSEYTTALPGLEEDDILPGLPVNENVNIGYTQQSQIENISEESTLSSSVLNSYESEELTSGNMYNEFEQQDVQTDNGDLYMNEIEERESNQVSSYSPSAERRESIQKLEENKIYSTGSLNTVLTKDKKIVAFVGASKSGTSFLVNNLACLFSSIGVKTAILDMTENKNSYYIYTNNDEKLRNIAYTSIENLEKGIAEGIKVDRNLEVYTAVPNDGKNYSNAESILSTLVQNQSLVLIDCDFQTDLEYFANAQEIYLVQSMDILTIQPLTAFLRDLKTKGLLEQEKLRIVINKELKVRSLSTKAVIGGMSFYNDPAMSYMTELFSKDKVKACTIPFDENVYSKYLEAIVNCVISINGYTKSFMNSLKILGNMVYPLLSKQTYSSKSSAEMNYGNNFSTEMNNTLNQMRNKY